MNAAAHLISAICAYCTAPISPDGHGSWVDATDGDGCDNPTGVHAVADRPSPFDEPEFWPAGVIARYTGVDGSIITVENEGEPRLERTARDGSISLVEHHSDFRDLFPGGDLPEDGEDGFEWLRNGWFAVYRNGQPDTDEPTYSLRVALAWAREAAKGAPHSEQEALSDADILREIGMDEAADDADEHLGGTF